MNIGSRTMRALRVQRPTAMNPWPCSFGTIVGAVASFSAPSAWAEDCKGGSTRMPSSTPVACSRKVAF